MRVLLAQRVLRIQFVDKKFSLPQIECLKRFREPIIDRDKKLASFVRFASIAPQLR